MLPRIYRLTKSKDFERLAKVGQPIFGRAISLKYIKNNLSVSRFGIIVSLKISKKAVVRNKLKRQLRAILSSMLKAIKVGYDVMILTRPEAKDLKFEDLKKQLLFLLTKAKLIE